MNTNERCKAVKPPKNSSPHPLFLVGGDDTDVVESKGVTTIHLTQQSTIERGGNPPKGFVRSRIG